MRELSDYWDSIPIGKPNRKTYAELGETWGMSRRSVRFVLHRLSEHDNGDGLVLIRSATSRGFYRTDDPDEIEKYRREIVSKATSLFAPLKKIRRIQEEDDSQLKMKI